mmetsp:Transcript_110501/g.268614  ORF Transcript_110501/g.268614 Transcript_110501/m.268614 type:complete len:229 (+) Transcript_110501:298-984(+)
MGSTRSSSPETATRTESRSEVASDEMRWEESETARSVARSRASIKLCASVSQATAQGEAELHPWKYSSCLQRAATVSFWTFARASQAAECAKSSPPGGSGASKRPCTKLTASGFSARVLISLGCAGASSRSVSPPKAADSGVKPGSSASRNARTPAPESTLGSALVCDTTTCGGGGAALPGAASGARAQGSRPWNQGSPLSLPDSSELHASAQCTRLETLCLAPPARR